MLKSILLVTWLMSLPVAEFYATILCFTFGMIFFIKWKLRILNAFIETG